MQRNYSARDAYSWKFDRPEIPQEWRAHLGDLVANFRMLIQGSPGHGKTEYLLKLTKMLAQCLGKVNYNNVEQGRSASLQDAIIRNGMEEVKGKWMMAPEECRVFDKWFARLEKRNSGRVIALDSVDYLEMTFDQMKRLHERFKHKAIIVVAWDDPMEARVKRMKYLFDIKVKVRDFEAKISSRFGGNEPYVIWDRKDKVRQLRMFGG